MTGINQDMDHLLDPLCREEPDDDYYECGTCNSLVREGSVHECHVDVPSEESWPPVPRSSEP